MGDVSQYSRCLGRYSSRDFAGYKSRLSPFESSSCAPVVLSHEIFIIKKSIEFGECNDAS
jgi:hypothetical protein